MLQHVERSGLDLLVAPEFLERGVLVAFTGVDGGLSAGPFSSLNLSYNVGDDRDAVAENRRRVAEAIGVPVEKWVLCGQVHGRRVQQVTSLEVGRGAVDHESAIPRTDGLVTELQGVAISVLTADCLPVVITAPGPGVAVAHAGWRGVLAGTAVVASGMLAKKLGCSAREITCFIGPHIGACCMEADAGLAERFRSRFGDSVVRPAHDGKAKIDLEAACRIQLESAGLLPGAIFSARECTECSERLFSYRRSMGVCGRQGGFAAILE